ncbi:protein unc-79 homolog isoform X4 [Zootermopsis nevadensis]|uniref:protein unc-79 homolog isoform X4 n=1 Tax=Zootermopsis nevadensis TaxID=136037 RepID=UPI000B8E3E03|nr:protein unc-79 homolog isoform X4 [Zootermopsis nevadensis]
MRWNRKHLIRNKITARIRNLHDYQLRLLYNIMPVPSGVDVANTLKYFSQTLLTVLKDVPSSPIEMLKSQEKDSVRLGLYPNLDYKGLYNAMVQLTDVVPLIQYGLNVFGQAMLQCLGCLLPFLDHDMIDTLPYMTASMMAVLPSALHQEIVNSLCFYILPFTITRRDVDDEQENYASQSVAAIIMMVFQYSEDPAHHCQLLECLMTNKKTVVKDLLCVIAYGTSGARSSAAKLLFYYWPTFNPNLFDRRVVLQKFTNLVPFVCQRDMCPNAGNAEAAKVCYDHCISITFASDSPPPLYLCIECANEIHREHPNQMFFDILHAMQQVSMTCENKNCRASDKYAVSICFSTECASYNGNHPIRYCQQCHNIRHNNRRGGDHIVHTSLPQLWDMDAEVQTYMVESIVSLLKEAKPLNSVASKDSTDIHSKASLLNVITTEDPIPLEERQLLGRYGVWLLVGLCTPHEDTPAEILGRILSMLFHWFDVTSYTFEDQESTLERLKTEFVCGWLSDVCNSHFKVFVSCLLPHPPDYARVGGHWDTLVSRTSHLKDGLSRLFSLVPYEIITSDIWDYVMPHWMEAVVNDVPEKEQHELKNLLSKMLDPDMSPLGFDAKKLYQFVAVRFKKTSAKVQEQALNWLQILTVLDIVIPLSQLFAMFNEGVRVMKGNSKDDKPVKTYKYEDSGKTDSPVKDMDDISPSPVREDSSGNTSGLSDDEAPTSRHVEFETDAELTLSCYILMLDVLLRQMELQEVEKHNGVHTSLAEDVSQLLKLMVSSSWVGSHSCASKNDCVFCESSVMWHQLALQLVEFLSPDHPVNPPDSYIEEQAGEEGGHGRKSPPESEKKSEPKPDVVINMPIPEFHSVGVVLMHVPHIMTATVETVTEQLDLAPIIPAEKVVAAVARAVTITDTDVATATAQVARPTLVGENDQPVDPGPEEILDDFWHTSVGKFRFTLDELPQHLQLLHELLKELPNVDEPDILYYMLQCLHILCLHGDALTKASKDHLGFIIWCQENLLIKNLWDMCNSEHSHICQVCVPLLLHCITLPSGSDVFWKVIQEEFHNTDWRVRFVAVERVTVIARFMDSTPLRSNLTLQAALANAFCYLISSMDDINVHVAQRATLYLGTIHDNAIKSLMVSLETQFDSVIVDRPMVLQSLYQLHNCLSDRKILTWEFFLNRFDALFLEAQINLEKSGDIAYLRDLRNTDLNSEVFIRKLHRAHEALSQQSQHSDGSGSSGVKTLIASFGQKWPYKRTMSAPASIVPRQDTKQEKEKVYNRQYSAPILKRKSSRFGLDGHIQSLNAGSTGDDGNLVGFIHHIIDLEEADRETMHLLVFLLMQFLSRSDQAYPSDEKSMAKTQTIVLRHLYLLLGYNQNERGFHVPPQRLRSSPVFNVFLANLPQLLDQNHLMGWVMLPTCAILLQYCPCPHHSPSAEYQTPTYSLWYLEPHSRRCWLMSLLVLLYKYQYSQQPHSSNMQSLVKIVLNTLDAQYHQCRRIPATLVMGAPPSRSRDVSQPSLGGDAEHSTGGVGASDRFETPPLTPLYSGDGGSHVLVSTKAGKVQATYYQKSSSGSGMEIHWEETAQPETKAKPHLDRKMPESSYSLEADETESELAAIPESPKSDSTLHGTTHGSFEELVDMNEACSLLTTDEHLATHVHPVTVNSETANMVTHEPPQRVVVENRPHAVGAHALQQVKTGGSGPEPLSTHCRPVWFLGSEEETLQTTESSSEKWGVKEGVKMMATSSLLSVSQPHVQRALTVTQNSTDTGSPTSTSSSTSRISASAVASSIAAVAVARTMGKDSHIAQSTPEHDRPLEMWPENPHHGSPVPRPLGRQKRMESALTSVSTTAFYPGSHAPAQHLPWQLDLHPKVLQKQPLIPQLATPSVERLLPIGTTRLVPRNVKPEDTYGSPESPLSKMDIMTVGSPVELDSENNVSSEVTSTCSMTQLELPMPERLLPIGRLSKESIPCLVEKVRQALGMPTGAECTAGQAAEHQRPTHLNPRSHLSLMKQDGFEKPDVQPTSSTPQRGVSPRRLIKQVALDSSPPHLQGDTEEPHTRFCRAVHYDRKPAPGKTEDHAHTQRHQSRKIGLFPTAPQSLADYPHRPGSWCGPRTLLDPETQQACHAEFDLRQSSFRIGDECVYERCSECGTVKEEYSDEELGLCIIILGTFIHREPALAAPLLPEILSVVAIVALNASYPWQNETNIYLPGGATSVAHQFLRCVLHQLAPNGIFVQMFQTHADDSTRMQFFRSVAQALSDFNELNPIAPLQLLLEGLNSKKSLPGEMLSVVLPNMACYLDCLPLEAGLGPGSTTWSALLTQLEILFRRLVLLLSTLDDIEPLLRIMVSVLKVPGISACKAILDPFSKVLGFSIENFVMKYHYLVDLCYLCSRGFTREREKLVLTRMVVYELVQALKFKTSIPDSNFLMLINFVLQDAGGSLALNVMMEDSPPLFPDIGPLFNTSASECMRQHLADTLEFLADFHTLSKLKSYSKGMTVGLNEDTLGGVLKSGIAQYLALEITRGNSRDNRSVARYLPWLYNAPSVLQQGPREFIDCVGHIRLLSWLLLGSLTHTALHGGASHATHSTSHCHCQPVPQEASCHIADHIQVIMVGFAELSKASVLHMSSLFHAFILCQLWTVYLEQGASSNLPSSEAHSTTMSILIDFWGKVTPSILQLVSHSKVLAEMVNLHFLSLLEAMLECNSSVLSKLLPVWTPVLFSYHVQLPGHLQVRLQACRNFPPSTPPPIPPDNQHQTASNPVLLRWLQRLQFKMGQIELQSSAATQFYSV